MANQYCQWYVVGWISGEVWCNSDNFAKTFYRTIKVSVSSRFHAVQT